MKTLLGKIILSLVAFSSIICTTNCAYNGKPANTGFSYQLEKRFDVWYPGPIARAIAARIQYLPDTPENHWQTPEETMELGTGDCEDFAFLLHSELTAHKYVSWVVMGDMHGLDQTSHAWVAVTTGRIEYYIEATTGNMFRPSMSNYREQRRYYMRNGILYESAPKYTDRFLKGDTVR